MTKYSFRFHKYKLDYSTDHLILRTSVYILAWSKLKNSFDSIGGPRVDLTFEPSLLVILLSSTPYTLLLCGKWTSELCRESSYGWTRYRVSSFYAKVYGVWNGQSYMDLIRSNTTCGRKTSIILVVRCNLTKNIFTLKSYIIIFPNHIKL